MSHTPMASQLRSTNRPDCVGTGFGFTSLACHWCALIWTYMTEHIQQLPFKQARVPGKLNLLILKRKRFPGDASRVLFIG